MARVLLHLGSNVGDRLAVLRTALKRLDALPGLSLSRLSRVYETAPIGPSRRPFLNMAAGGRCALSPMGLLAQAKRLEALAGRRPGPRWGPRPLDIDILAYGRLRLSTPWLALPHPEAARRAFVLAPAAEIAPGWRPDGRSTAAELLERLNPAPGTVKIYR